MDSEANKSLMGKVSRRTALKYGVIGAAGAAGAGALAALFSGPHRTAAADIGDVFKGDAPRSDLWEQWRRRGWVKEAAYYLKFGRNVQCKLCPNNCFLEPGDRSHCRNKVNVDGVLYTLAYGNPCTMHVDPIEKKPLFHFLPGTRIFSLATAGCVFRCLNCQNWEISQRTPEETKDPRGPELRVTPANAEGLSGGDVGRMSLFPDDLAALTEWLKCPSIAYTYSEPIAYYEYTYESCKAARAKKLRNVLVTCGSINEPPLVDLCQYLDGAHVDLKGFDEETYRKLNSGSLQPILNTLKTMKRMNVWFEVINLVVPTWTDKMDRIKAMCEWLVENVGPDYPMHFSRYHPAHKLQLSPTPVNVLLEARGIARSAGLRYVYIGNVSGLPDAGTTHCPKCGKAVIERNIFSVKTVNLDGGKCKFCGASIAGVWT